GQKRFIEGSADEYLQNLDALSRQVPVGAAPHSVRACPLEWIRDIAAEAFRRGWPLHLHVSEQRAEVEQSQAEHGTTPALVLERLGALRESTTAVHGVHLTAQDIAALGRARATVCACPTTERNLGDGVVRADLLLVSGVRLCTGSDSEVQLSPLEDARQLEYHLRLVELQRAVLDPEQAGVSGLGAKLYGIASAGGMRALGLGGGALALGDAAAFILVALEPAAARLARGAGARAGIRDPPPGLDRLAGRAQGQPDRAARPGRGGRAGAGRPQRLRPLRRRVDAGARGRAERRQALRPR